MGVAEIIVCVIIIAMLVATVWDVGGQAIEENREYVKRERERRERETELRGFKDFL